MKRIVLGITLTVGLVSCGGYTEEQGKAADALCECMETAAYGDFDIDFYECNAALEATYSTETFEEGSWLEALEEKCPEVAGKME